MTVETEMKAPPPISLEEGEAPAAKKPKRVIKTAADKVAAKPASKEVVAAAPKAVKPKPEPKAKVAKAPTVHAQRVAGVDTSAYSGASDMINANRKTKVMQGKAMTVGSLSDRMKIGLYALRKAYENKPFAVKGFDNGVIRDLQACGILSLRGGKVDHENGTPYLMDQPGSPVLAVFTAAGMNYGKVKAAAAST